MKITKKFIFILAVMFVVSGVAQFVSFGINSQSSVFAIDNEDDDDYTPPVVVPTPTPPTPTTPSDNGAGQSSGGSSSTGSTNTAGSNGSTASSSTSSVAPALASLVGGADYKKIALDKKNEIIAEQSKIAANRKPVALNENKLDVCKNRLVYIKNTMTRMTDRAIKHVLWLDDVVAKAQAYIKTSNLTIDNYSSLMSAVSSARASAEGSINATSSYTSTLMCDSKDFIGISQDFKAGFSAETQTINTYKTAVKNLLTTIKNKG